MPPAGGEAALERSNPAVFMQRHPHPAPGDFGSSSLWKILPGATPLKCSRSCQAQPTVPNPPSSPLFPSPTGCTVVPVSPGNRSRCRGRFGASQNIPEQPNQDDALISWCRTRVKPKMFWCETRFNVRVGLNPKSVQQNGDRAPLLRCQTRIKAQRPQCLQPALPPPPNPHLPPFFRISSSF